MPHLSGKSREDGKPWGSLSAPMVCPRDTEQKRRHGMPRQRAAATPPTPPPTPHPLHTQVSRGSCRRSGNELRERDHRGAADLKGACAGGARCREDGVARKPARVPTRPVHRLGKGGFLMARQRHITSHLDLGQLSGEVASLSAQMWQRLPLAPASGSRENTDPGYEMPEKVTPVTDLPGNRSASFSASARTGG